MTAGLPLAMIGQEPGQAGLLVTLAGPPDSGLVALHAVGDDMPPLTCCDGQHDAGTADLIPG
jgi:hypothetical protein